MLLLALTPPGDNPVAKQGKYGGLSWHKKLHRWYKKLKNPDTGKYDFHYFGPKGKSPSDRACKKAAEAAWEVVKQERAFKAKVLAYLGADHGG
jgi:hypothetical protein